jgi:hypothetical protein
MGNFFWCVPRSTQHAKSARTADGGYHSRVVRKAKNGVDNAKAFTQASLYEVMVRHKWLLQYFENYLIPID